MTPQLLIVFLALLAAGLGACVYLFIAFKQDLRRAERRWSKRLDTVQSEAESMRSELAETRERLHETEENAGLLVPPQPALSGLNLGKRSQAIRMFRRGERPEQIAAVLRLPVGEVDLLLKVHRIVLSGPAGECTTKA
jgi:hypothetical protein